MDRLAVLSRDLSMILDALHDEAERRELTELQAPLSWLDEAHDWLRYELARANRPAVREAVPFTYIPVELRK
jgi:hypothetical protein